MLRIGLIYDVFDAYPWRDGEPADADAEYEPPATVEALEQAVRHLGHDAVRVGTARDLLNALPRLAIDAAINITESAHSRNREAYAPILLEMAGIPFIGSDALTLSLSLDKAWTKDLALAVRVPTPPYRVYRSEHDVVEEDLPGLFPLFAKPRYEGSAKGITRDSVVANADELRSAVCRLSTAYRQDVLVEQFVDGGEYTVAIIGNDPPEVLPVLPRAVEVESGIGLHALEHRGLSEGDYDYEIRGRLNADLEATLQDMSLRIYEKLECLDFARIDYRTDRGGDPFFLEVNPLPTFAPDGTFAIIAELLNRSYEDLLAEVIGRGLRRLGLS